MQRVVNWAVKVAQIGSWAGAVPKKHLSSISLCIRIVFKNVKIFILMLIFGFCQDDVPIWISSHDEAAFSSILSFRFGMTRMPSIFPTFSRELSLFSSKYIKNNFKKMSCKKCHNMNARKSENDRAWDFPRRWDPKISIYNNASNRRISRIASY